MLQIYENCILFRGLFRDQSRSRVYIVTSIIVNINVAIFLKQQSTIQKKLDVSATAITMTLARH